MRSSTPNFRKVCHLGDIPEGEARLLVIDGVMIAVFNLEGSFFALANECPHAGASLARGVVDGDTVSCRIHYWRFSIRDGTCLDEDRPACDAQTFPVRLVGNEVQVAVDG